MTQQTLSNLLTLSRDRVRPVRHASRLLAALLTLGALSLNATVQASSTIGPPPGAVTNPISQFGITIDGKFTDGSVSGGLFTMGNEWSDITPLAFISPPNDLGTLLRTNLGDPRANSLLYAGLDPGVDDVYLMYDFLPRTDPTFALGAQIADIQFPITLPNTNEQRVIDVIIEQGPNGPTARVHAPGGNGLSPFDESAGDLGMEFGVSFGPSTLSTNNHLLIELSVPLRIPKGFGPAFPGSGIDPDTGLYSPLPAFWGGDFTNNAGDPPATSAIFTINPDGSTLIVPQALLAPQAVPEPSTWAFITSGLVASGVFGMRRKRRTTHA